MTRFIILFFLTLSVFTANASCVFGDNIKTKELPIGIILNWTTLSENNNATFIIEKSSDGKRFISAGQIKGAGISNKIKDYNFLDAQSSVGSVHYRIKQIDNDGTFTYSPMVIHNRMTVNDVQIMSYTKENAKKTFDVSFDILNSGTITYQIIGADNKVVIEQQKEAIAGVNTLSVELSGLKEGVYKFNLKTKEKEMETLTFRRSLDEFEGKPAVASTRKAK
jgi:hypothetical protein